MCSPPIPQRTLILSQIMASCHNAECVRGGYALSTLSGTNKGCTVATQALTLDATNAEVAKLAEHLDTALQSGYACVNLTMSCDVDGQTSSTTTTIVFGAFGVLLAVAAVAALFAVRRRVLLFRQLRARRAADLETQVRSAARARSRVQVRAEALARSRV